MKEEIRLAVVDDHQIVRLGIRHLLKGEEDIRLVGEAECGAEALELARSVRPDVMLVDVKLPDISGIEVVHRLKSSPETAGIQAVILTVYDDLEIASEAIRAGAVGYILKDSGRDQLLDAVRSARKGMHLVSSSVAQKLVSSLFRTDVLQGAPGPVQGERAAELTERELEVVRLVAKGYSNKSVARELSISLSTVKTHLHHIFQKLEVQDRAQLIVKAIKEGII